MPSNRFHQKTHHHCHPIQRHNKPADQPANQEIINYIIDKSLLHWIATWILRKKNLEPRKLEKKKISSFFLFIYQVHHQHV